MMKHAYLILAHSDFQLLEYLLMALDDVRNDIYVHIDKKVTKVPQLTCKYSNLYVLDNREKVYWGSLSMVKAEYQLFETAYSNGRYSYYHLLSGADFPLKSQNYIHSFFCRHNGKEFIGFSKAEQHELDKRVCYYHLFPRSYRLSRSALKFIRSAVLHLQILFKLRRNTDLCIKKGSQWVSITENMVRELLDQKPFVMKRFRYTFCPDELFVQTVSWRSSIRANIFDTEDDGRGCMRAIGWKNNQLPPWTEDDYEYLINSERIFARKFSSESISVVKRIFENIKDKDVV